MKQLHIREPWAHLAQGNDEQLVSDLLVRIQILETKIRELEALIKRNEHSEDRETVGV